MSERELFLAALEIADPAERALYLDRACGDDEALRRRIDDLLAAHEAAKGFLEQPAAATPTTDEPAGAAADADADGPALGTLVAGRYKLLQLIGEGGMGAVFMAEQQEPVRRLVAVKIIKAGLDGRQVLARFEAERQALALMDHPNIAKVLDAGATGEPGGVSPGSSHPGEPGRVSAGRPYFVMELVKGVPITQFCDQRRLTPRQRLELFVPVCHAVQHAHQKGVIHRDLKPSNVLVALYDGVPVPKVIDFGVAKAAGQQLTDRTLVTAFGALVGTLEYMAPEQAELNQLDIDTRSDVYALGVLLYELLTGATPLDGGRLRRAALLEVLRVIREEDLPKPSARLSTAEGLAGIAARRATEPKKLLGLLRGDLEWVMMKCLEKDRARRYETANGLAMDVQRYLADEPVQAGPPSAAYRLRKFVRRNRAAVTAAGLVLLALVAGVAATTWQAVRATRAEGRAVQERNDADAARAEEEVQRKRAECQAARAAVQVDLKYCQDGDKLERRDDRIVGLLRLCRTLKTIPEHAKELRENVVMNVLTWGQTICLLDPRSPDGFRIDGDAKPSPDGLALLTIERDGTGRLWDALTGRQTAYLRERPGGAPARLLGVDKPEGYFWSGDSRTVVTKEADGRLIRIWEAGSGVLRATTGRLLSPIRQMSIANDGLRIAMVGGGVLSAHKKVVLWDATNGHRPRELSEGHRVAISPDGRRLLTAHGRTITVWATRGGHPLESLREFPSTVRGVAFSPSGERAVVAVSGQLIWLRTSDWSQESVSSGFYTWHTWDNITEDFSESFDFIRENIVCHVMWSDGFYHSVCVQGKQVLFGREVLAANREHLLDVGGGLRSVKDMRPLPLPSGRRFRPEVRAFAPGGRILMLDGLVDLATELPVGPTIHGRWGAILGGKLPRRVKVSDHPTLTYYVVLDYEMVDGRFGRFFWPRPGLPVDPAHLELWAQVVARGELDSSGHFVKWDEPTWQDRRWALQRVTKPGEFFPIPSAPSDDPAYWLETELSETPEDQHQDRVKLLDRLIAVGPRWVNYAQRAKAHRGMKQLDLAARDHLRAAGMVGETYWKMDWADGYIGWEIAVVPGRPREHYDLALRYAESWGKARTTPVHGMIALILYRLGRYADALARLEKAEAPQFAKPAAVLMSPWTAALIGHASTRRPPDTGLQDDPGPGNPSPAGPDDLLISDLFPSRWALMAICLHRLGRADDARSILRRLPKTWDHDDLDRELLREAEKLIGS